MRKLKASHKAVHVGFEFGFEEGFERSEVSTTCHLRAQESVKKLRAQQP